MVRIITTPILAALALVAGCVSAQYQQIPIHQGPIQQGPGQNSGQGGASSVPASWFIAAEAPTYNNKVVSDLLSNISKVRKRGEAYATFDWDNTCMYGDISYTSVSYQVENLIYRIPPSKFEEVFAMGYTATTKDECLPEGINSVIGKDAQGKNVTLQASLASTSKDYKVLYDSYISAAKSGSTVPPASLEAIKNTEVFKNFRAKLAFLIFGLESMTGGDERNQCSQKIAMTVFPQLLVGMTDAEIRTLIRDSLRYNLAAKLETPSFSSTGELAVSGSYMAGLRVFNGQETTMRALRQQGVDVFIISASPQAFVEEVGAFLGLTFLVPKEKVYGVRFTMSPTDKTFTGKLVDNYPITWGPGKAKIVEKYLKPMYKGKAPIYASGDSTGDCDMLDTVRDGVVHVNNRLKTDCIELFYEKACQFYGGKMDAKNNKYLLQGQDKGFGSWIPTGYTTKDGVKFTSGTTMSGNCSSYNFEK